MPDGVWDFTHRFVIALMRLEPERASTVAEQLATAKTDEDVEAATAEAPEVQNIVRELQAKPDVPFWKQLLATAAIGFLSAAPGVAVEYQSKTQAHEDATKQIELAERQLELAEKEAAEAPQVLDQDAVNELVAAILRQMATQPDQTPTSLAVESQPAAPGRNQPCWCGSGKKYKFCHLRDDEGSRQSRPPPTAGQGP